MFKRKRNADGELILWTFVVGLFLGCFHRQQLISILTVRLLAVVISGSRVREPRRGKVETYLG